MDPGVFGDFVGVGVESGVVDFADEDGADFVFDDAGGVGGAVGEVGDFGAEVQGWGAEFFGDAAGGGLGGGFAGAGVAAGGVGPDSWPGGFGQGAAGDEDAAVVAAKVGGEGAVEGGVGGVDVESIGGADVVAVVDEDDEVVRGGWVHVGELINAVVLLVLSTVFGCRGVVVCVW
ncbi:Uncharacterised protein [Dermatophilus congolensis]|uniref:Uncharacterized protein n=1 Tax=Dermatophilus congolensis TaxID=1863 RepID=A0AA46BL62_9MICO|nr:Uncharacterised protein [Dermatophilus congolensis]